jgi:hypothetical protein
MIFWCVVGYFISFQTGDINQNFNLLTMYLLVVNFNVNTSLTFTILLRGELMLRVIGVVLCVGVVLGGCAKRPNAVVPASLPSETYASYSCDQLNQLLVSAKAEEKTLTSKQRGAADADAIGVFLVGVPIGGLAGGDVEGELSVAKGKVLSIESQRIAKQCGVAATAPAAE